jgi:hypothetical protein
MADSGAIQSSLAPRHILFTGLPELSLKLSPCGGPPPPSPPATSIIRQIDGPLDLDGDLSSTPRLAPPALVAPPRGAPSPVEARISPPSDDPVADRRRVLSQMLGVLSFRLLDGNSRPHAAHLAAGSGTRHHPRAATAAAALVARGCANMPVIQEEAPASRRASGEGRFVGYAMAADGPTHGCFAKTE